jgi:radical SAM protein with 4Fe4S-binding SPASM domain
MEKRKFVLQWHLTHKCNLRCKHCYQEDYSKDLSFNQVKDIFNQFKDFIKAYNFIGHINFTGGEPLLYDYLFDVLDMCESSNITFGLLTNGTLLTKDTVKRLGNYKNLRFIQVSIDGMKETHDNIRGVGNFDKTFNSIKLINKNHIQSMVAFTAHKNNYEELDKVIKYCRKKHVSRFWVDRLVPIGSNTENILTTSEYQGVVHTLVSEQNHRGTVVHINRAIQFLYGGDCIYHCSAGDDLLCVLADGTLLPCRRLPFEIGNLLDNSISALYNDSKLIELRQFKYPDECKSCGVCNLCKGGAKCLSYAVKGTYNTKDIDCDL